MRRGPRAARSRHRNRFGHGPTLYGERSGATRNLLELDQMLRQLRVLQTSCDLAHRHERTALIQPRTQQALELRQQLLTLELSVQREDVRGAGRKARDAQDFVRGRIRSASVDADELIERRQRRRNLHAGATHPAHDGKEWTRPARVARVLEADFPFELERVRIDLPAGRRVRLRHDAEDIAKLRDGALELAACPGRIGARDAVLPAYVVEAVHTHLEACITRRTHRRAAALADHGAGQQRAVQKRPPAVVRRDGGAADLAQKPPAEDALQGSAGVIRADAEIEGCTDVQTLEQAQQARHALERAAQRIDVHLERDVTLHARVSRHLRVRAHRADSPCRTRRCCATPSSYRCAATSRAPRWYWRSRAPGRARPGSPRRSISPRIPRPASRARRSPHTHRATLRS